MRPREMKSQKHRDFLDRFMGTAEELIIVTDARGIVRYINKRGLRMLECEKQEILGKNWHLWLAPENWPAYGQEIFDKIKRGELPNCYVHSIWKKNGGLCKLFCQVAIVEEENKGSARGILCTAQNLTETQEAKRNLRELIYTDYLTGLYNNRYLYRKIKEQAKISDKNDDSFSLLYVDIDNFKRYNDVHGHQAGDRLLRSFSKIVSSQLREGDCAFRYGGEEFIVLLPCTHKDRAREIAISLRREVEKQLFVNHGITVSIGVAEYETGKDIVEQSDQAMYRAKKQEKNKVCVYDEMFYPHRSPENQDY